MGQTVRRVAGYFKEMMAAWRNTGAKRSRRRHKAYALSRDGSYANIDGDAVLIQRRDGTGMVLYLDIFGDDQSVHGLAVPVPEPRKGELVGEIGRFVFKAACSNTICIEVEARKVTPPPRPPPARSRRHKS